MPDAPHPDLSPFDPQATVLHLIVRRHIEDFLRVREAAGTPMADFVVDELRSYLRCGVLAHGAACFRCEHCGHGRMVALSCKGRGFCPAVIFEKDSLARMLDAHGLPNRIEPIAPARAPPQMDFDFEP